MKIVLVAPVAFAALLAGPLLAQTKIPEAERTLGAEIPRVISRLQMEADELKRSLAEIDGKQVEIIYDRSSHPWAILAAENESSLPMERAAALDWAEAARKPLQLEGFSLRAAKTYGDTDKGTAEFALYKDGLAVFGSTVSLHWQDGSFQGATAAAPRQLGLVEEVPAARDSGTELQYVPFGRADGRTDLAIATVRRTVERGLATKTFVLQARPTFRVVSHGPIRQHPGPAAALRMLPLQPDIDPTPPFQQWIPPVGNFPDQVGIDSNGRPWVSVPNSNRILRLSPKSGTWTQVTAPGTPDGLVVDGRDEVWYGAYDGVSLGRYTTSSGQLRTYAPPINANNMAVPNVLSNGHVMCTDHTGWLFEFDPATETWADWDHTLSSFPHLVNASEDTVNQLVVMTQYGARSLGLRPTAGGSITDIALPGSGSPAFVEASGGIAYFSVWDQRTMGACDPATGQVTYHDYPLASFEHGGPIDVTPGGNVVTGTRGNGFIAVFRPAEGTYSTYAIPTASPLLKDGLRVAEEGVVWFSESGANRLTRLRYLR